MKDLIIKDLMCLRKQRIIFIYTVVATAVLSVMFVLSARYGNIHAGTMQMVAEKQLNGVDVKNMGTMALVVFMILPIALVGDAATVFVYDGKAGFANVCATLPLSINRRVMAKFITVIMMFGIGVSIDLVISFVLSVLTDIITFSEFLGIIISTASVMGIYGSITIFYCFCLGYGKESYAQILSIFSMVVAFICLSVICAFMAFKSTTWLFVSLGIFVFFAIPVTLLTISYIKAKSNDEQIRKIILISYILSALMLIALAVLSVLLFGE